MNPSDELVERQGGEMPVTITQNDKSVERQLDGISTQPSRPDESLMKTEVRDRGMN